jgi:hypothetical protein
LVAGFLVLLVLVAAGIGLTGSVTPAVVALVGLVAFWCLRAGRLLKTRPSHQSQRLEMGVWLVFASLLVAGNAYAPAEPDLYQRILASSTILLTALPTVLWLRGRDIVLPFFSMFGAIYGIYYAWGILFREQYTRAYWIPTPIAPDSDINYALFLGLLGFIAALVGYYTVHAFASSSRFSTRLFKWDEQQASRWLVPLGALGLALYALDVSVEFPKSFAMPLRLVADLSIFAIIGLFVLWQRQQLASRGAIFLWGFLLPARVFLGFSTGLHIEAAEPLLALVLAGAILNRRVRWSVVALGLAALIILQPAKSAYRTDPSIPDNQPPIAAAASYARTTIELVGSSEFSPQTSLNAFMTRMGYVMEFAKVTSLTPERVPYWGGETYKPLLTKPVPRVMFPEKPEEATGQDFGHRYNLLRPSDTDTSYNMPQLIELYSNFGAPGTILGMGIFAALYRFLAGWILQDPYRPDVARITAAAFVFVHFLHLEGAFSQVMSQALYRCVLVALIARGVREISISFGGRTFGSPRARLKSLRYWSA